MNLKVGDKVQILTFNDLMQCANYDLGCLGWRHPGHRGILFDFMTESCGMVVTVAQAEENYIGLHYNFLECSCLWADWMVKPI